MIYELVVLNEYEKYQKTILIDDCISAVRDRKVNSFNTFTFSLIENDEIHKNYRVLFKDYTENKWYEYIVSSINRDGDKVEYTCESSFYSTLSNYVDFVDITGNTVTNGLSKILNNCTPISDWHVGTTNISGSFYMQRTRKQLKEVILSWCTAVNGELCERIEFYNHKIVRYIDIFKSVGEDRGCTIYDDREINNINVVVPSGNSYTSAYGYGASVGIDENCKAVLTTFADVEWSKDNGDPLDKPLGQTYLDLEDEYKEQFGILINGQKYHRVTTVSFNNVTVPENLLERTYQALMQNIEDNTEYQITSVDLKKLGYDVQDIRFGDSVRIFVSKLNDLRLKSRVIRYKDDFINPTNNYFELNNYTKNIVSSFSQIQNNFEEIKTSQDGMLKELYRSTLEKWNAEINADSTYLVEGNPLDGLIAYNASTKEEATKATRIKGGSIQISNTKENGEFVWSTVLTGDGVIADTIITGILKGNMFELDLMTGVVKMGKRDEEGVIVDPLFNLDENGNLKIKAVDDLAAEIALTMRVESEGVIIESPKEEGSTKGINSILMDGSVINLAFNGVVGTSIDIKGVDTHNITLDEVLYHKPILQTPYRTANGSGGIKFTWGGFD